MRAYQQGFRAPEPAVAAGPSGAGGEGEYPRVWTYGLFDFDPKRDGDEAVWAGRAGRAGVADVGTRGSRPWRTLEGRRLRR